MSLKDTLDCGSDPNIFSTPATLLHTTVFASDNFPAHLPSHTSTILLLCTTLPFSDNSIPTLVNSSATDNFIDKSLVVLTPQHLCCLLIPILLKLFDNDPTPTRDITHCLETTVAFTNRQQQELQLLVTKLHPSAPIILGFSWLCSTNPHIDWPSLTLCLDQDNSTNSRLVPFNVSPPSKNPKTMIDQPWTLPQLCSNLPKVLPTLINSGTFSIFVSSQLDLQYNNLNKPLELQLFDGSPAMTGITQYYNNTLTLNNDL
ncbi:hypothetical protein C0989_007401, partial [Termitomyces sp. Mn162]